MNTREDVLREIAKAEALLAKWRREANEESEESWADRRLRAENEYLQVKYAELSARLSGARKVIRWYHYAYGPPMFSDISEREAWATALAEEG